MRREKCKWRTHKHESTEPGYGERRTGTEGPVVAKKPGNAGGAKGSHFSVKGKGQQTKEEPLNKTRQHNISQEVVATAYEEVRSKKGAAGIDAETIEAFDKDAENKLYKIWNRMSSGSYMPPPVKTVEIPKGDGKSTRKLGIPTVSDRIAQTVAVMYLQPLVEPKFHVDSYGYRRGQGPKEALAAARTRCWKYDWVVDLDIKGFFDNLDHALLMEAVKRHTDSKWLLIYIARWLEAPVQERSGELIARTRGTPQGGVISPLLANIYLHHAFDEWMAKDFPSVPFERFADDIVVHCKTEAQAKYCLKRIAERLRAWNLELHPEKTRIVYCKDSNRTGKYDHEEFDFLGYTFRQRETRNRDGKKFGGFLPAISAKAKRRIRNRIREWKWQQRTDLSLERLAEFTNDEVRGWHNYYGMFSRAHFLSVLLPLNLKLIKWVQQKYRKGEDAAWSWLRRACQREPTLFVHWSLGLRVA